MAAGAKGFTFQAVASKSANAIEKITVTASVLSSNRSIGFTIDPTPKFQLRGNNQELSVLANGASVHPSVTPPGWEGALTIRGGGYVSIEPVWGIGGLAFRGNGAQNWNTSFINFTGSNFGAVFNNASEISFFLKSAYSFTERRYLPSLNMRSAFEVFDNSGSWYSFSTYTSATGQLQFSFGAQGYSSIWVVPSGEEDRIFGRGVVAKIRITWTSKDFNLYVNDELVRTVTIPSPKVPYWSANSALTVGSRSTHLLGGGYYASDDVISNLVIR